jgi:phosphatidylserine decarboxylase
MARYKMSNQEISKYAPSSDKQTYLSFQDFFTRKLIEPLNLHGKSIFPVEGMICESGQISALGLINVKGRKFSVRKIFENLGDKIPDSHTFINIFLHNHNYHRFHSPISGTIKNIEVVPGNLNFLRPWLYSKKQISEPAFVNERIIMEIEERPGESWFLSFVGGMGVGQIKMHHRVQIGNFLSCGEEIGLFLLGSTCCMAIPKKIKPLQYLQKVEVGIEI